jgi:hypothetical protein
MTRLNLEKMAAERRMRQRGTESVHESGLGLVRRAEDRRHMDRLAERIGRWAKEPSIEEAVEKARHLPEKKLDGRTRAETDEWSQAIRDACED